MSQQTVKRLLTSHIDENTKVSTNGAAVSAEFLACFVREAINRSAKLAKKEKATDQDENNLEPPEVELKHVEMVLPELLCDF